MELPIMAGIKLGLIENAESVPTASVGPFVGIGDLLVFFIVLVLLVRSPTPPHYYVFFLILLDSH